MDGKLKVWLAAIGFLVFLWIFSPSQEEEEIPQQQEAGSTQGTAVLSTSPTPQTSAEGKAVIEDPSIADPQPIQFQTTQIPITTRAGNLPLTLGIAHTRELQRAGLMYNRVWPNYMHGLLFLFQEEDTYSMWMHKTYLPLDMLFIDRDGYIVHIVENTKPLSDEAIQAPVAVLGIIEIPAGNAKKWGIREGDRVRMKFFRSAL